MINQMAVLAPAVDREGNYSAKELAKLMGWSVDEISKYLERSPTTVYRKPSTEGYQDQLGALAGLFRDIVATFTPVPGTEGLRGPPTESLDPVAAAKAWLRTSIYALDGKSPKERILSGDIGAVRRLVSEYASGLAY
jgi:hypothetical protein